MKPLGLLHPSFSSVVQSFDCALEQNHHLLFRSLYDVFLLTVSFAVLFVLTFNDS